jgi:expansin (peptidoglycan-binding protein)
VANVFVSTVSAAVIIKMVHEANPVFIFLVGGKTVEVGVYDRCEGCKFGDIDLSPNAFSKIANFDQGRVDGMQWEWIGHD